MGAEILQWGAGGDVQFGTLAQYIARNYPCYGAAGCCTWEDVLEYIKKSPPKRG